MDSPKTKARGRPQPPGRRNTFTWIPRVGLPRESGDNCDTPLGESQDKGPTEVQHHRKTIFERLPLLGMRVKISDRVLIIGDDRPKELPNGHEQAPVPGADNQAQINKERRRSSRLEKVKEFLINRHLRKDSQQDDLANEKKSSDESLDTYAQNGMLRFEPTRKSNEDPPAGPSNYYQNERYENRLYSIQPKSPYCDKEDEQPSKPTPETNAESGVEATRWISLSGHSPSPTHKRLDSLRRYKPEMLNFQRKWKRGRAKEKRAVRMTYKESQSTSELEDQPVQRDVHRGKNGVLDSSESGSSAGPSSKIPHGTFADPTYTSSPPPRSSHNKITKEDLHLSSRTAASGTLGYSALQPDTHTSAAFSSLPSHFPTRHGSALANEEPTSPMSPTSVPHTVNSLEQPSSATQGHSPAFTEADSSSVHSGLSLYRMNKARSRFLSMNDPDNTSVDDEHDGCSCCSKRGRSRERKPEQPCWTGDRQELDL